MDALRQAERAALRASDNCVVLTPREATALRDEIVGLWTLPEAVSAELSHGDLGRAWRVLNNQIAALSGDVESVDVDG
jgi:hypothetical protein